LRLNSRKTLERLFAAVDPAKIIGDTDDVYANRDRYLRIIDDVIAFLQGRDPSLAHRFARGGFLPEGPSFRRELPNAQSLQKIFGPFAKLDQARYLASLMIFELAELFRQTISPHYMCTSYGEKLLDSRPGFDAILGELVRPSNVIEDVLFELCDELLPAKLDLVCLTCPFPGNLIGSLLIGKWVREHRPGAKRALGGGYPSTELRQLADPRVFDYVDYVTIDDGELPLSQMCARIGGDEKAPLHKTFTREDGRVVYHESKCATPRFREIPTPDYAGFDLSRYIHLIYSRNPISRIQNEGTWLKLTAAHGCYWKKCTFCDIHLPYISEFDPLSGIELADQMDAMHAQTGVSSFHFTDEAAPAPLLVNLALELLRRDRSYQFWGNIRFDPGFTPDRCRLLAAAGMIAVTGGIEIASDELLPKIAKGITIPQVVKVLQAFAGARILTHAYLIYGFPGERLQDTMNSLEILRQLVGAGVLNSGYFHCFSATAHSPIGRDPELFGIKVKGPKFNGFAHNVLEFDYADDTPHAEWIYNGLAAAIHAYACGEHLARDVRSWFNPGMPAPTVSPTLVADLMRSPHPDARQDRLCWIGGTPRWENGMLAVSCERGEMYTAAVPRALADGLLRCHPPEWRDRGAPRREEFEQAEWFEEMRSRGLVLV
jgi:hypothetical protein